MDTAPPPTSNPTPGTGWVPPAWPSPAQPTPAQPTPAEPTPAPWGSPLPLPPVPPKRHVGRWIAGLGVLALVGLGVAGVVAGNHDTGTSTADGLVTASDSGSSSGLGSSSLSLPAWATLYGQPDAQTLSDDMDTMSGAASSYDIAEMTSSCRAFQRHLATAESHLPTPNAGLTSALRDAYDYYDQAASACIAGTISLDPDKISESSTDLTLGTAALQRATSIIRSLS
jgi:hypothetical protein